LALDVEVADGKDAPGKAEVAYWTAQISAAKKREESYRKRANRALKIYQLEEANTEAEPETPFNILFSNTETLLPALYNEKPRPIVKRRFDNENPVAKFGSEALSRGISFQMDNPSSGYEGLHPMLENAVLSALVPGRGITRFSYDADITEYDKEPQVDVEDSDALADGDVDGQVPPNTEPQGDAMAEPAAGAGATAAPPKVENETICSEIIDWDSILFGYAKRWDKVPWVAFEWKMTKKDVEKAFGGTWADKLTYASAEDETSTDKKSEEQKRPEETARVWEIWHKTSRKVKFFAECHNERMIKTIEDPLGLSGFYPIPEPLTIFLRVTGLVPVPIYDTYRRQARELNRLTIRIEKITEAVKVRGFYNSSIGDIQSVFKADDNELIPAKGPAAMSGDSAVSLDKAIWTMPLDVLVTTLNQLTNQRELVKQVIYEITGISDILRGSSVPSETATAQNIKNQWGTLRLKKIQKRVQRYVRDCFRIMAEIMAEKFGEDTFKEMTGIPLLLSSEKEQLGQQLAGLKQQQQMQQQQAQMMAPPDQSGGTPAAPQPGPPSPGPVGPPGGGGEPSAGGPPQPPDPLAPQIQELEQQLAKPSWGEVLGLLKSQLQRGWAIDVETDSTVDPEATEDRQQMGEVLQAFGQAMGQLLPFVQQGLLPMPVLKAMLKDIVKKFRFGAGVEEAIDQMADQLPPQPEPEGVQIAKIKAQSDQQKGQGNPEVEKAKAEGELRKQQGEMALMDKEIQVKQKELEIKERELELKEKELGIKEQAFQIEAQGTMEQAHAKRQLQQVTNDGKIQAARAKAAAAMMQPQGAGGMGQPQQPMGGPSAPV
jgi:hypothetical protein